MVSIRTGRKIGSGTSRTVRLLRALRLPLLVTCLLLVSAGPMLGQAPGVAPQPGAFGLSTEDMKWAVGQGGLLVVILVVLAFYRRDFIRELDEERQRVAELMAALKESTTAQARAAESARQQSEAFARMVKSVEQCEAVRQMVQQLGQ